MHPTIIGSWLKPNSSNSNYADSWVQFVLEAECSISVLYYNIKDLYDIVSDKYPHVVSVVSIEFFPLNSIDTNNCSLAQLTVHIQLLFV